MMCGEHTITILKFFMTSWTLTRIYVTWILNVTLKKRKNWCRKQKDWQTKPTLIKLSGNYKTCIKSGKKISGLLQESSAKISGTGLVKLQRLFIKKDRITLKILIRFMKKTLK